MQSVQRGYEFAQAQPRVLVPYLLHCAVQNASRWIISTSALAQIARQSNGCPCELHNAVQQGIRIHPTQPKLTTVSFLNSGSPFATPHTMTATELSPPSLSPSPSVTLRLPLTGAYAFDLERAVCSHGLFMMAPNRWDRGSRTFRRPLRLASSPAVSVPVSVSQCSVSDDALEVQVSGTDHLSDQDREAILGQVKRMLRISASDDGVVRGFHEVHEVARMKGFGRIFRSPTLFEDMVKCILLCNCQWPRTLAMAKSLCDLQLELKAGTISENFKPKTPQIKEQKRKRAKSNTKSKTAIKLETKFAESIQEPSGNVIAATNNSEDCADDIHETGDFPTAEELAALDATYLAERCKLGYRTQRILSLAQGVVSGEIQLKRIEESCNDSDMLSWYDDLYSQLLELPGFGPFTCANVLMCLGYFHKIPADSETMRHLKTLHKINCTITTIGKEIVAVYGKYAPFQFLAYWFELWEFYEETFGKTSDMTPSEYLRITAANMKTKGNKRIKG